MIVHELTAEECEAVLARTHIGRLACARRDQPYVVPVSFAFDATERSLVGFATVGQKIEWMRANPRVCVEAEEIADDRHWTTIVIVGRYEEILSSDTQRLARAQALLNVRQAWWLPATARPAHDLERDTPVFYRIIVRDITGRRTSNHAR
jgi:hypothetical protein